MGKLKNRKAAGKDEIIKSGMTGWWTGFGGCVIWPVRVLMCCGCSIVQGCVQSRVGACSSDLHPKAGT